MTEEHRLPAVRLQLLWIRILRDDSLEINLRIRNYYRLLCANHQLNISLPPPSDLLLRALVEYEAQLSNQIAQAPN